LFNSFYGLFKKSFDDLTAANNRASIRVDLKRYCYLAYIFVTKPLTTNSPENLPPHFNEDLMIIRRLAEREAGRGEEDEKH
jgi:hypothetical protein